MSDRNQARRTAAEVRFDGTDITKSILPYLLSITYTDNEEDETDDLQIKLQDRDGIWTESWLQDIISASASGFPIGAVLKRQNWNNDGGDQTLDTGEFELDAVDSSGPPATVTIKGTSLPYAAQIRQTKRSQAWEAYNLSGIANEMAGRNGMTCMYESASDPYYQRVEQYKVSDIAFLSQMCHDAGISLKATNKTLVLFDQASYEKKAAVKAIQKGDGSYTRYKLGTGKADVLYGSCRVSYTDPVTKSVIEGTATDEDGGDQCLEISAKVSSQGEAQALAAKRLRLHNKFSRSASFTMPLDLSLVAGVNIELSGWGGWDGKYTVKQAKHTVGSPSTTQVELRKILEGY